MADLTNYEAVDIIEDDGVGYAVRHYTDGSAFKDPHTAGLWDQAAGALEELVTYLERETGREVEG